MTFTITVPDEEAEAFVEKFIAPILRRQMDPLLTCSEIAERLNCCEDKARQLVRLGKLERASGFSEIRVRQSKVDALGTATAKK